MLMVSMAGNGEFVIVLDSQDRENEGDLIIAAETVTEAQMAFLVRYSRYYNPPSPSPLPPLQACFFSFFNKIRFTDLLYLSSGYVCAPILPSHADKLLLPQMVMTNTDPMYTAYTISVDANDTSVTTGISAHDRALTCRRLADLSVSPADFRRPGHILPLRARLGGVRERRGHTEAAVDLCRLAGRPPAGVIGELVEEGEVVEGIAEVRGNSGMMRRDACLRFGKRFGLKAITIEDLVAYLEKVDPQEGLALNGKH